MTDAGAFDTARPDLYAAQCEAHAALALPLDSLLLPSRLSSCFGPMESDPWQSTGVAWLKPEL